MRFDDTNPAKENTEFENIILEDVKLLNIDYDIFSFTSNHFLAMLEYAEEMIKKVYLSAVQIRKYSSIFDNFLLLREKNKHQHVCSRNPKESIKYYLGI